MNEDTNLEVVGTPTETDSWDEPDSFEVDSDAENQPQDEPEDKKEDPENQKPELFELKHLGKVSQVSRDDLIALAQKGMDYDHVKGKLEAVETKKREESDHAVSFLEDVAQQSGMTVQQLIQQTRDKLRETKVQNLMAQKGIDEATARERVALEEERASLERAKAKPAEPSPEEQRRKDNIREFAAAYPGVMGTKIPPEVWAAFNRGESLTVAYAKDRERKLKEELESAKQTKKNREQAPGSVSTAGDKSGKADPFLAGWNSAY